MSKLNKQNVILLGAGGHAKVVADALIKSGINILGVVSPDKSKGSNFFGLKVLGNDEECIAFSSKEVKLANGIGAIPGKKNRWELADKMRKKGYQFIKVIHPSALIAKDVVLEEGVQIMAGVIIQPGSSIGQDTIVNSRTSIDHDCKVGINCHLAPGVVLSGFVNIDNGVQIGTGTIVIQKIKIGQNSVIAAGSVIYKSVASDIKFIQKK